MIDSIERNGAVVYRHDPKSSTRISSVDEAAFYQLKTMMQGVLARGTARAIADLSPYVAGKTGTSDDENDAWFVGFTNDVTVAVWIGYDNADNRRRTLGGGSTGGGVAVPIFEPVIQAVWADVAPRTALAPPSPEARRHLSCKSIDLESGEIEGAGRQGDHRVLPGGWQGQDHRYPDPIGLAATANMPGAIVTTTRSRGAGSSPRPSIGTWRAPCARFGPRIP